MIASRKRRLAILSIIRYHICFAHRLYYASSYKAIAIIILYVVVISYFNCIHLLTVSVVSIHLFMH